MDNLANQTEVCNQMMTRGKYTREEIFSQPESWEQAMGMLKERVKAIQDYSNDVGFIYGYLAGWEPERILNFANICAGLSTRKAGGTAAQATFKEARRYL